MESFDIKVKKTRKVKNEEYFTDEETDEGSDISEDEVEKYEGDEEHDELLEFFTKAFPTATVELIGYREFDISFDNPNVILIEEEGDYDFDIIDDVPALSEAEYFIPFVNFLKEFEPSLTGISLVTNLEGGGELVI